MGTRKFLLTSFQTWMKHQKSNSSDDLLELLQDDQLPEANIQLLRQLPVDTKLASQQVLAAIASSQPDVVLCCGMAESRFNLTLESHATDDKQDFQTKLNLDKICGKLTQTTISHDAGKFVCEGLYFHVLQYIQTQKLETLATFVHVPSLTATNQKVILQDFQHLLKLLSQNLDQYQC